jgi:hypothetical protein
MQTSINKAGQPVAVAGMLSDNGPVKDIVSRFSEDAVNVLPFGIGVKVGSKRNAVDLPSTIADTIDGVNVFGYNHLPGLIGDLSATLGGLKQNAGLQVLRIGRIYVVVDSFLSSISANIDRTYLRAISHAGVGTVVGAFTNAADGSDTIDLTKDGVFVSGIFTSADGTTKIAEAEFNFTAKP